jgi:formylglycine-generating enzyme required for sulfatase activity
MGYSHRALPPALVALFLSSVAGVACISNDVSVNPGIGGQDGGSSGVDDGSAMSADGSQSLPVDSGAKDSGAAAECEAGAGDCVGSQPRTCVGGKWQSAPACTDDKPVCSGGACIVPPSCGGLTGKCGAGTGASCCNSLVAQGATFNRFNNASFPATVSSVRINTFEVTVGRFRAFVDSGHGTSANPPAVGSGAHPKIPGSGWLAAYNALLQPDSVTFRTTLTACAGKPDGTFTAAFNSSSENKPINCAAWADAFAFCIWDGGRLPTIAELELATRGGVQQRTWPWGLATIDTAHAYYCDTNSMGCASPPGAGIPNVGLLTAGAGRFGHLDLYGSMREQTLDIYTPMPATCTDCAQLDTTAAAAHGAIGGSYSDSLSTFTSIYNVSPTTSNNPRTPANGVRCAYDM